MTTPCAESSDRISADRHRPSATPRPRFCLALLAGLCLFAASVSGAEPRVNEAQVIGTHNSYHIIPDDSLLRLIATKNPDGARSLEYTHRPLPEQFDRGIRQIELDIYADPRGGLFAHPQGNDLAKERNWPVGPEHDPAGVLRQPGFKILHIPDFDFRVTTLMFRQGLEQIRDWSRRHPRHFPIFVLLELKDEAAGPEFTKPVPWGTPELDGIDSEIRAVFKEAEVLTPDKVRGRFATLPEALKKQGWPELRAARGKVMFALDNGGAVRDLYLQNHPALQGRVMFVSVEESHPAAAWMKMNDPVADFARIQALVKAGFLVRTRADADLLDARANDPRRREQAFASGAQFISTDFPEPNPKLSPYVVRFEGGVVARANPVNGDTSAKGKDLEKAGK